MSKYKEIKGFKVQTLASDTAASVAATGTWASAPNMNVARNAMTGFGATNTAAIGAGGYNGTAYVASAELYNGSSWTEVNDLNTARGYGAGAGTSTAGLFAGGHPGSSAVAINETWNGTSFTEANDLNAIHSEFRGCGTSTAAIVAAGLTAPYPTITNLCEVWDGTNWTEVADLNIAGVGVQLAGTSTLAIANSGANPSPTARATATELWNGSSWTNSTASNSGHREGAAAGIQTDALMGGGAFPTNSPSVIANTEIWNGTAWTEVNDMATARSQMGSTVGQQTNSQTSLAFAGETAPGGRSAATEEWTTTPAADFTKINLGQVYYNSGSNAYKVTEQPVPGGSWSSGGAMNTARRGQRGSGSKTAGLVFGGGSPPPLVLTESYNGTAFTEVADLNTAKNNGAGFGTQASTIATNEANVELWNGSSWTETTEVNTDREAYAGATGPTSAGIIFGGTAPPYVTNTETWNGSAWTEVNDLNNARAAGGGAGLNSGDAICILGDSNPYSSAYVETWDGTNWTEVTQANTGRYYNGASGASSSSAITYGGYTTAAVANTESWNGTAWTEIADLATARFTGGSGNIGSSSTSAYYAGGGFPDKTNMEEWTVDVTNTTITVS